MKANLTFAAPHAAQSFRAYLQSDLASRCAGSPQYSLRAYAMHLNIDHASLSQLLRGRRPMTAQTIRRLGQRLALGHEQIEAFIKHEQLFGGSSTNSLQSVRQLAHDAANIVGEWHHYAILELVRLEDFKPDSRWIARVLGISVDEVNVALQRLLRLGMLKMTDSGRWTDLSGHITAGIDSFAHAAVQRLSQQARALWLSAQRDFPIQLLDHSSVTVAVNTARLPELIERIASFRRELLELLERDATRDDVYQLEINLFPLTTLRKQQENPNGPAGHAMADSHQEP